MGAIASQITSLTIVFSTVYSDADQRKHQSSVSQAFVRVNSLHKWPVMRKMFPFDYVITQEQFHMFILYLGDKITQSVETNHVYNASTSQ